MSVVYIHIYTDILAGRSCVRASNFGDDNAINYIMDEKHINIVRCAQINFGNSREKAKKNLFLLPFIMM